MCVMHSSAKLHMPSAFFTNDWWYWSVMDRPLLHDIYVEIVSILGDVIIYFFVFSTIRQDEQDLLHACSILSSNQCHSLPWFVLSQTLIYVDAGPLDIISLLRKSKSRGGQTYWLAWLALESIGLFFFFNPQKVPFVVLWAQVRSFWASAVSTQSSAFKTYVENNASHAGQALG